MSRRAPTPAAAKMAVTKDESVSLEDEDGGPSWRGLDMADGGLLSVPPALSRMSFLTHLYLNSNKLAELPSDISSLKSLVVLNLSSNNLTSVPASLGELSSLLELDLGNNSLTTLPFELGQLHLLKVFELKGNAFQDPIAGLVKNGTGTEVLEYLIDNSPVTVPKPAERKWIVPAKGNSGLTARLEKKDKPQHSFFCYNILCDRYASRQMFRYCPTWALVWSYRKGRILAELEKFGAGILCLQEVSMQEYYNYFAPKLSEKSYDGLFVAKSKASLMNDPTFDGCATFYNKLLYEPVFEAFTINFGTESSKYAANCPAMINRCMSKDNVAQITTFRARKGGALVVVANVHLTWDPIFCDVKIIQIMLCLHAVKEYYTKHGLEIGEVPLVLMGDFNSEPESGVVEFISKGAISPEHSDFRQRDRLGELVEDDGAYYDYKHFFEKIGTTHPFHLRSAYTSEMPCTNRTVGFTGIIDYIWYSHKTLHNKKILGSLPPDYLSALAGCPNVHMPSDHLPLAAQLIAY